MSLISKQSLKINNIGEGIVNQLLEESTPIVALYPGKFKPPHAGHFDVISKASKIADKVIVIMSNISKDEFTPEDSMKVWRLYKDILPNNTQIIISDKASPISEVFNIIKDKTQDFLVLYGKGERSRYASIERDREKYSNVNIIDSGTFEDLHATDLRNAIRNKDLEGIQKYLPQGIDAKKVLSIYTQDEFKPGPILYESFNSQKVPLMKQFVEYACNKLNIDKPKINIINSPTYSQKYKSFGGYIPSEQEIKVVVHNRNMADILRTLAHELVHHMQNLNGDELNGEDGSDTENQANAMAGVLMREFGRNNPEIFESKEPELFLNKDKFAHPLPLSSYFSKALHEIKLKSSNAVELNGSLTKGTFQVGNKTYKYEIKPFLNPYNDGGTFYNIEFHPIDNKTNLPTRDTPSRDYIKILSTIYNIITDFLKQEKPDYLGISSMDNPEGKEYHIVYANLTDNSKNNIPGYFRKDVNLLFKTPEGSGRIVVMKRKDSLDEKIVGDKIECNNCNWNWDIKDGGDDLFICHKCGHDNEN